MSDIYYIKNYENGAIQNAAKCCCQPWSFVAWNSVIYLGNTGVSDLVLVRCSLP